MSTPHDGAFDPGRRSFLDAVLATPLLATAACSRPPKEAPMSHPQVDPAYRHYTKQITPRTALELEGARLKWYDIHRPEAPPDDALSRLSRDFLSAEGRAGKLELEGDIGFALLHLCSSTVLLLVCTWRNENELWESCYAKHAGSTSFELIPREGRHKPTYCVWEMGAVSYEAQAWSRYLVSARDEPARRAYLDDRFAGSVLERPRGAPGRLVRPQARLCERDPRTWVAAKNRCMRPYQATRRAAGPAFALLGP